jgi:hypothetical protein
VDEAAKEYTVSVTLTSAVKDGTNTITEWYLRDLFYSSADGVKKRPPGFGPDQVYESKLVGEFTPKPKRTSIDFSKMLSESDWAATDTVLTKLTVKEKASAVTANYTFDLIPCSDNQGSGTITLLAPENPGGKHGRKPTMLKGPLQQVTLSWEIDSLEEHGQLKLGQGPGTEPVIEKPK